MSVKVENLEHNMAKLTIDVPAADFEAAIQKVFLQQRSRIAVQGCRKGKVPRIIIEKMYGADIFYEDAANQLLPKAYDKALEEVDIDIVSMPKIDVDQMEKGKDFIFTAEVAVRPEVELGKYVGVTVTKIDTAVADEEIDEEIEAEREKNSRLVTADREVKKGDTAVIDFEGFIDGVAFEGGKGENQNLEIGSGTFIDNFEDQLIGKKAGDDVDVNVTFPEGYQAEELAGKPALFKVKIHEVKEKILPELDDEFAQDVSEFDTFEEYKASIKEMLEKRKEDSARATQEEEAIAKIVDKSKMDIPEAMVESQVQRMINDFSQRIGMQGLSMDMYMDYSGADMDSLKEQMRPEAETNIKNSLVLGQIVKEENIEVTDEELGAEKEKLAKLYNMTVENFEKMLRPNDLENIEEDLKIRKAIDFVMDNSKKRAQPKKKSKDEEAEEASEE